MILALLLACGQPEAPLAARALQPWPAEPQALLRACQAEPFPELATTCRVQAAARLAALGRGEEAGAVCVDVPAGTWREECHFRVGEELATAGQAAAAAAWCGRAGWFARRCITHAAWRLVLPGGRPAEADLGAEAQELLSAVEAGLSVHEDPGVAGEGRDAFKAAWGRAVYRGTGRADPMPARRDDELGPALRTGWATEAVRLIGAEGLPLDALSQLAEDWRLGRVREGAADPSPPPERYAPLRVEARDQGLPHLPMFGGGLRLVGESVDEDAAIAIIEAIYGHPGATAAHLEGAGGDGRERVRWTVERVGGRLGREK